MIEISNLAKKFAVENPKKLSDQEKKGSPFKRAIFPFCTGRVLLL